MIIFSRTQGINPDTDCRVTAMLVICSDACFLLEKEKKKLAPSAQSLQQDEWAACKMLSKQLLITQNTSAGEWEASRSNLPPHFHLCLNSVAHIFSHLLHKALPTRLLSCFGTSFQKTDSNSSSSSSNCSQHNMHNQSHTQQLLTCAISYSSL